MRGFHDLKPKKHIITTLTYSVVGTKPAFSFGKEREIDSRVDLQEQDKNYVASSLISLQSKPFPLPNNLNFFVFPEKEVNKKVVNLIIYNNSLS